LVHFGQPARRTLKILFWLGVKMRIASAEGENSALRAGIC